MAKNIITITTHHSERYPNRKPDATTAATTTAGITIACGTKLSNHRLNWFIFITYSLLRTSKTGVGYRQNPTFLPAGPRPYGLN